MVSFPETKSNNYFAKLWNFEIDFCCACTLIISCVVLYIRPSSEVFRSEVFWRDYIPAGSNQENCYMASEKPDFSTNLSRRLNKSRAFSEPNCNLVQRGRSATSELGLSLLRNFIIQ